MQSSLIPITFYWGHLAKSSARVPAERGNFYYQFAMFPGRCRCLFSSRVPMSPADVTVSVTVCHCLLSTLIVPIDVAVCYQLVLSHTDVTALCPTQTSVSVPNSQCSPQMSLASLNSQRTNVAVCSQLAMPPTDVAVCSQLAMSPTDVAVCSQLAMSSTDVSTCADDRAGGGRKAGSGLGSDAAPGDWAGAQAAPGCQDPATRLTHLYRLRERT